MSQMRFSLNWNKEFGESLQVQNVLEQLELFEFLRTAPEMKMLTIIAWCEPVACPGSLRTRTLHGSSRVLTLLSKLNPENVKM